MKHTYAEGTLIEVKGIVYPIEHLSPQSELYYVEDLGAWNEVLIDKYLWAKTQIGKAQINGKMVTGYTVQRGQVWLVVDYVAKVTDDYAYEMCKPPRPFIRVEFVDDTHDEDGFIKQEAFDEWVEKAIPSLTMKINGEEFEMEGSLDLSLTPMSRIKRSVLGRTGGRDRSPFGTASLHVARIQADLMAHSCNQGSETPSETPTEKVDRLLEGLKKALREECLNCGIPKKCQDWKLRSVLDYLIS